MEEARYNVVRVTNTTGEQAAQTTPNNQASFATRVPAAQVETRSDYVPKAKKTKRVVRVKAPKSFWGRVKKRASGAAAGLTKIAKSKGVRKGASGVGQIFQNAGEMFDEPKGKRGGGGDVFSRMDGVFGGSPKRGKGGDMFGGAYFAGDIFGGGPAKRKKKRKHSGRKVVIYV